MARRRRWPRRAASAVRERAVGPDAQSDLDAAPALCLRLTDDRPLDGAGIVRLVLVDSGDGHARCDVCAKAYTASCINGTAAVLRPSPQDSQSTPQRRFYN